MAGRTVDQRAYLYSVGAMLYHVANGGPPFDAGDSSKLIHDHLARMPVPPAQATAAVPAGLSQVIMHLLEKEPDNRYQTPEGLIHDLAECGTTQPRRCTSASATPAPAKPLP